MIICAAYNGDQHCGAVAGVCVESSPSDLAHSIYFSGAKIVVLVFLELNDPSIEFVHEIRILRVLELDVG